MKYHMEVKMKKLFSVILLLFLMISVCRGSGDTTVGSGRLDIPLYPAADGQTTHPSVITFDQPWNGYLYWMASTPFPYSNGEEENPCITASNDLYNWEIPKGAVNPIAFNEETASPELKDPCLFYREDLDRLEVWYLGILGESLGGDGETLYIYRKCSTDGVIWTPYEILTPTEYLCPSVYWDGEKYCMYESMLEMVGTGGRMQYRESYDGFEWSEPQVCTMNGRDTWLPIWHSSVTKGEKFNEIVYVSQSENNLTISYSVALDGINFNSGWEIVRTAGEWKSLYKPCLIRKDGICYLYYGVITHDNRWYISMSSGPDVNNLIGIAEGAEGTTLPGYCVEQKNALKPYFDKLFELFDPLIIIILPLIFAAEYFARRFLSYRTALIKLVILAISVITASLIILSGETAFAYCALCGAAYGGLIASIECLIFELAFGWKKRSDKNAMDL